MDEGHFRDLGMGPGGDTRQWVSYGIVEPDASGSEHSVRFKDGDGQPLPHGALVDVQLQPSGIVVPCRVMMRTAGSGEGEWDPIGPGDEVLVAIPGGHERGGCCILGRTSNNRATFPSTVAGQDVTNNSVVMRRYKSPFILESGSAVLFRNAATGAQLALDSTGGVIFASGDKHMLAMTASAVSLSLGDGSASFQLVPDKSQATIQAVGTSMLFDDVASIFQSGGTLQFQLAGGFGQGHAVTLEQVVGLLINYTVMLGVALKACAPPVALDAGILASPATLDAFISSIVLGAASPVPCVPPAPGGIFAAYPLTFLAPAPGGAIAAAMASSWTLSSIDPTGTIPGVGRPGFLL